jgi:Tol biopolymer transport system component
MRAGDCSRTLTLVVLLVAGLALGAASGCSATGRGGRLSSLPRESSRIEQRANQQPFDLMPASSPRRSPDADPRSTQRDSEAAEGVRVSPDGKWMAFESDRGGVRGVWIARRDGSGAQRISGPRLAARPTWSPDGSRLIFLERQFRRPDVWSIWMAEVPGGSARRLASLGSVRIAGAAWFPDSRRVCYGSDDRLVVLDTSTRALRAFRVPADGGRIAGTPAVSPDGVRVVFAVAGDGVWIAALDGRMQRVISEGDVDAFAWAPGGRQIAFRTARDGQWKLQIVRR